MRGQWVVILGCVILLATALFHDTGYTGVASAIEASGAKPVLVSAVKASASRPPISRKEEQKFGGRLLALAGATVVPEQAFTGWRRHWRD
jgi:hypothetical protein